MKENNSHIVNVEQIDNFLGCMGFIYPINENQLDIFDALYADFDFKLKNATINVSAIINNQLSKKSVFKLFENNDITNDIEELRMVARKGSDVLPQDIIDKMYTKHRKKTDDKE